MYLASLILGFAAWGLSAAAIARKKNYAAGSYTLCTASLFCQLLAYNILANKGDWSAIEDTCSAITFAAAVLVTVTLILNLIAALRRRK